MQLIRESVWLLAHDTYATIYTVPAWRNLIISGIYSSSTQTDMRVTIRIWWIESIMLVYKSWSWVEQKSFIGKPWDVIQVKHNSWTNSDITICWQLVLVS